MSNQLVSEKYSYFGVDEIELYNRESKIKRKAVKNIAL